MREVYISVQSKTKCNSYDLELGAVQSDRFENPVSVPHLNQLFDFRQVDESLYSWVLLRNINNDNL